MYPLCPLKLPQLARSVRHSAIGDRSQGAKAADTATTQVPSLILFSWAKVSFKRTKIIRRVLKLQAWVKIGIRCIVIISSCASLLLHVIIHCTQPLLHRSYRLSQDYYDTDAERVIAFNHNRGSIEWSPQTSLSHELRSLSLEKRGSH
jgi:hypothetical protein